MNRRPPLALARRLALSLLASSLLASSLLAAPAMAQTARSLSDVPKLLTTPEGKAVWQQQMMGEPIPDGLGTRLPDGLRAEALVPLLVPEAQRSYVTLVGAKPWARRANSFVVIVCTKAQPALDRTRPDCGSTGNEVRPTAYVGVVERLPDGGLKAIAGSGAVTTQTPWRDADLPASPLDAEDAPEGKLMPEEWLRMDLANYRLRDDATAFGVRAGWRQGYAGGGAEFEALYLFMIDGDRLRVVLAAPMFAFEDIAGDWHPDGTRDHDISEASKVLVISQRKTAGYYDIELREKGARGGATLQWSAAERGYR